MFLTYISMFIFIFNFLCFDNIKIIKIHLSLNPHFTKYLKSINDSSSTTYASN